MAKATAQQCHALTSHYITKYTEIVGRAPLVNRNKSRWGFESMLLDYAPGDARELIDYYIDHYQTPTIEWFLFNYEKVDSAKKEFEEHKISSTKRLKETQKRLEEWRDRWQQTK